MIGIILMVFSIILLREDSNDIEAVVVLTVGILWVLIAFVVTLALSMVRTTRGHGRVFNYTAVLFPYE